MATVGFIGLGDMGGAMARRIIDAGWSTILWARRAEVLEEFLAPTVQDSATPADLAARADLIGICVWADDDVREVLVGDDGVLAGCRPGTVVAIHSTVAPGTCRDLADLADQRGVVILDAPVTGGRTSAERGELTMAIGGDASTLDRCRQVFGSFASEIVHVGGLGAGQLAKLINNTLLAANIAVADDALTLGIELGLTSGALAELLRTGSGRSYGLDVALASRRSPETRAAMLPALDKDVHRLVDQLSADWDTDSADVLLLAAAVETLRRVTDPPAGWQP